MKAPPPWLLVVCAGLAAGPSTFPACLDGPTFHCENAVSHLKACCPATDFSSVYCEEYSGCGSYHPMPLSVDESRCIADRDCIGLLAAAICTRVATRPPSYSTDGAAPVLDPVCP